MKYSAIALAFLLSACSAGPHLKVGNAIFNLGQDVPDNMKNVHLTGYVGFDEDYAGRYNRVTNNLMYGLGVVEGTPEYQYRVVRLNTGFITGMAWYGDGDYLYSTGGFVPDSLPRLRAGDVVEFRQTFTWDALKDFSKTGEGTVVTKILCRKAQPDYEACLDTTPHVARHKGYGPTGRPFPASVKEYGFTFTPMYDSKGIALRPFPVAAQTN